MPVDTEDIGAKVAMRKQRPNQPFRLACSKAELNQPPWVGFDAGLRD